MKGDKGKQRRKTIGDIRVEIEGSSEVLFPGSRVIRDDNRELFSYNGVTFTIERGVNNDVEKEGKDKVV